MALTKTVTDDKLEIVSDFKDLQIRTATSVKNADDSWTHTDTDVSGESTEIRGITSAVWTNAVKAAKKAANEAASI